MDLGSDHAGRFLGCSLVTENCKFCSPRSAASTAMPVWRGIIGRHAPGYCHCGHMVSLDNPQSSFSHLGAHLLNKIVHPFSQLKCDAIQLCRHFLGFADHLKGTLNHDVTAILCDDGFVLIDIGP
jgi:hypothetical protein